MAGGIYAAFWLKNVVAGLEFFWQLGAMMGIPFWLGIFWRRATNAGAWAAALSSIAVGYMLTRPDVAELVKPYAEFALASDGQSVSLPWRMLSYLTTGIGLGIVVSLFTRRTPTERLDRFYNLLKTPVQAGEVITTPCSLPEGVMPANPPKLIDHPDVEIYKPTRADVFGFVIAWVFVLAIIGIVIVMAKLGA